VSFWGATDALGRHGIAAYCGPLSQKRNQGTGLAQSIARHADAERRDDRAERKWYSRRYTRSARRRLRARKTQRARRSQITIPTAFRQSSSPQGREVSDAGWIRLDELHDRALPRRALSCDIAVTTGLPVADVSEHTGPTHLDFEGDPHERRNQGEPLRLRRCRGDHGLRIERACALELRERERADRNFGRIPAAGR